MSLCRTVLRSRRVAVVGGRCGGGGAAAVVAAASAAVLLIHGMEGVAEDHKRAKSRTRDSSKA